MLPIPERHRLSLRREYTKGIMLSRNVMKEVQTRLMEAKEKKNRPVLRRRVLTLYWPESRWFASSSQEIVRYSLRFGHLALALCISCETHPVLQVVDDVGDEGDDDEEDEDNQEDDNVALHNCCSLCVRNESGVVGRYCEEELGIAVRQRAW